MLRKKKSQTILEYVIIFTAIVTALYVLLLRRTRLGDSLKDLLDKSAQKVSDETDDFTPYSW